MAWMQLGWLKRVGAWGGLALALAGCNSAVGMKVQTSVPEPVVAALPVSIGLYYDQAFLNSVYHETSEDRGEWEIDVSQAQRQLFDAVIPPMFAQVRPLTDLAGATALPIDAVLAPELLQLQFALPQNTKSEFYEAWMKYRIHLTAPDGAAIAAWDIVGYGKSTVGGLFESKQAGLNQAMDQALRNVGANVVVGFARQPAVQAWLCATAQPRPAFCPAATPAQAVTALPPGAS